MSQQTPHSKNEMDEYNSPNCVITMKNMYRKYSSSQIYFYTNIINDIVKEKRTNNNIIYEDVQYICDSQQYLKRWYSHREYQQKMFTFKEYYFYHEDCPRIFMKRIEDIYTKWQDKKRDMIYRKLKLIYNEEANSDQQGSSEKSTKNQPPITHFLNEISEYNPFSKNYYLRVQARKEKQQNLRREEAKKNKSKFQLSNLQHQLSQMLGNLGDLSVISTLIDMEDTPKKRTLYQTYTRKGIITQKDGSHQMSTNSQSNSSIKFNFKKKNLDLINQKSKEKLINRKQINSRKQSRNIIGGPQLSKEKLQNTKLIKNPGLKLKHEIELNRQIILASGQISPKLKSTGNNIKSIFSVSSFGGPNNSSNKLNIKRETLKLNFESHQKQSNNNGVVSDNINGQFKKIQYESQKPKVVIKSKSTSKVTPQKTKLQKIRIKQIQVGKPTLKLDEFSDKKFEDVNKFRSHKSQYSSSNSLKKPLFRISQHQQDSNFKRTLQLKHY